MPLIIKTNPNPKHVRPKTVKLARVVRPENPTMNRKDRVLHYWFALYMWAIIIFIGSSIPAAKLPDFRWNFVSVVFHVLEYFILGFLCIRAIRVSFNKLVMSSAMVLAFLVSIFFALTDEIHQQFVPGRLPELQDLLNDGIGISIGLFTYIKVKALSWLK